MTELLEHVGCDLTLSLWVHVTAASNLVAAGCDDLNRLGEWDSWERNGRNHNVDVEEALDVVAVLLLDRG